MNAEGGDAAEATGMDAAAGTRKAVERGEGKRIALVLGAGGARGLAHIGIIEALEARGYRIAAIGGSSMGALVGGIHAAGKLREYRDWVVTLERSDVLRLLDFAFGHPGLIKGERIIGALRELVGDHRIEDLPIPYLAVATDLRTQREVWLTRGPLFDAIRASIAIPMVFTPHVVNGRELVDGGLLAPVPMAATRAAHTDLVVAVDVNARVGRTAKAGTAEPGPRREEDASSAEGEDPPPGEGEGLRARIGAFIDGLKEKTPELSVQPGLMQLMARSLDTMQAQIGRTQLAMDPPDLLVRVPHDACYFYEFWRAREMIEVGRRAAEEAIDAFEGR